MDSTQTILIIEDSEDDRELYERLLRGDPSIKEIRTAETGQAGIAAYQANRSDCVLLDYNLPGHHGIEVLEQFKAFDNYAPVVMLTGEGSEDIAVAAMKGGASDYVVKDTLTAAGLRRAVANAIEKSSLQRQIAKQQQEQDMFVRTLIHDASAPIRHIASFTELLDEDIRNQEYDEVLDHNEAISLSARRLQDLIDTLASYALSQGDVTFEPVAMDDMAKVAIGHLAHVIEERHAEINVDPLPTVMGHAPQLIQLLQNLIGNGIKYNQSEIPKVWIRAPQPDDDASHYLFVVGDNGIGIPEDRVAYVFQPFKRLWSHDKYEGTGLGLAICQKIVERHGGKIWCEAKAGEGARFCFTVKH